MKYTDEKSIIVFMLDTPSQQPAAQSAQTALEHERLTSLINSMADGVIATDERGNIVLYNGAALNILDINELKAGLPLASVMRVIDKNNQAVDMGVFISRTRVPVTTRDYRLAYSDGSNINLYLSIAPVHLGYGKEGAHGFVVLLRDITREKSLEEERDEFISVVSHELRTPITIAEGNISNALLIFKRQSNPDKMIEDALTQAHDQINFLAGMINDLSTLSRAERGKLAVEVEDINAHELVEELLKNYEADARKKSLELHSDLDPNLQLLKSSKLYVREILQNFITNAIKYTEKGSVTIGARQKQNGVQFYVADTGIGIGKGDQKRVFDKFFRSEDFRTRQNSGTGLGLYVTTKLVRLVHAELNLESELNKGSTFTVFVPNLK